MTNHWFEVPPWPLLDVLLETAGRLSLALELGLSLLAPLTSRPAMPHSSVEGPVLATVGLEMTASSQQL